MHVLVVDDDKDILVLIERFLLKNGHQVSTSSSAEEAWALFQKHSFPLVITDWMLPAKSGLELCSDIKSQKNSHGAFVLVLTARDKVEDLIQVLDAGADDYISKPFDIKLFRVRLTIACNQVENLIRRIDAEKKVAFLEGEMLKQFRFHDIVGRSKIMRDMVAHLKDLAAVDATALIQGETGTGKELVARAIHFEGTRKRAPFIPVNCGGFAEDLIASQLFGHRKGAFTGAITDRKGVFEAADGGTIFLDEIGDLPLNLQTSFLRVLESREVVPLGETRPIKVNVRVVAATNRDLEQLVMEKTFRSDLLYRIRVGRVLVPSLSQRKEDISLLATHFLRSFPSNRKQIKEFEASALNALMVYPWPGNVRELRNAIEFALISCKTQVIGLKDLPPEITQVKLQNPSGDIVQKIKDTFLAYQCNHTATANALGMSRATYYRKIKQLDLQDELERILSQK